MSLSWPRSFQDSVGGIFKARMQAIKVVVLEGSILDQVVPDLNHIFNPYPDAM